MTRYLVSFGTEGLETVLDLDDLKRQDEQFIADKLADMDNKTKKSPPSSHVMHMLGMRYRINMHRKIVSYILEYDGLVDDIWQEEKFIIKFLKKNGNKIKI